MPRDPRDISLSAPEQQTRRIAENEEAARGGSRVFGQATSGAEGKEGAAGKNGATWYSGTTVPSTGLGVVGDFYLRTTTSDVYKKTGEVAWSLEVNIKGATGSAGTNGSTWFSGATEPEIGTGSNGDYYFRTETNDVYKKEAGTWNIVANLKGASGKEGPAGSTANNDWKNSVRAATTANITISTALNPTDVLDGVTLAENDRVLVKNQTTKSENGIWIVKAVPVRAEDADAVAELSGGSTIYVEEGTRNKRRTFQIVTPGNVTPGTTAHEYQQLGFKDFGIVEALPTTEAVKNDKCTFKAATGIYWDLIYYDTTGEETYPWAVIGGGAMRAESNVERELNNQTTYASLPTDPLKITAPLKGIYDITIEARVRSQASSRVGLLSYAVGATVASDNWCIQGYTGTSDHSFDLSKTTQQTVTAAAVIEEKGKTGGAYLFQWLNRRLRAMPIRVG